MAQKGEKDETELKVPESLSLCSPPIPKPPLKLSGTDDQSFSSARLSESLDPPKSADFGDLRLSSARLQEESSSSLSDLRSAGVDRENKRKRKCINRCSGCKRKVGLMGFRCRCGDVFCWEHRYSDRHECSFDYKAAGRESIARENPVVRAAKILKV